MSRSSHPDSSPSHNPPPKQDQPTSMQPSNVEGETSPPRNDDALQQPSARESTQANNEDVNHNPDFKQWLDDM
ncbi:Protein of unknown function [Pyronema omphalodes CBS 100304]|uniref:Uncharacterized protein n=1 Tax=Pyronema omphalodes (strain CBS 100304) TaxID=1076935 RepID=U4L6A3_PYROM|nr:Protein of unknown function [Pyronema omphalodes CBS 100304]